LIEKKVIGIVDSSMMMLGSGRATFNLRQMNGQAEVVDLIESL